ncbi:Transposase [compost metagenome]
MVESCPVDDMDGKQRKRPPGKRQQFTPVERAEAVRIVRSSRGRSILEIAAELGINDKTLNAWVVAARNAEIDPEGSMTDAAKRRIRELEKEVARLEKDLEFEKKARAFTQSISLRRRSST